MKIRGLQLLNSILLKLSRLNNKDDKIDPDKGAKLLKFMVLKRGMTNFFLKKSKKKLFYSPLFIEHNQLDS